MFSLLSKPGMPKLENKILKQSSLKDILNKEQTKVIDCML